MINFAFVFLKNTSEKFLKFDTFACIFKAIFLSAKIRYLFLLVNIQTCPRAKIFDLCCWILMKLDAAGKNFLKNCLFLEIFDGQFWILVRFCWRIFHPLRHVFPSLAACGMYLSHVLVWAQWKWKSWNVAFCSMLMPKNFKRLVLFLSIFLLTESLLSLFSHA